MKNIMSMSSYIDELFIDPLENALDDIDNGKSINDVKEYINSKIFKYYFNDLIEKFIISTRNNYSINENLFYDECDVNFKKKNDKFDSMLDDIYDIFNELYYSGDEIKSTKSQIKKIINKFNTLMRTRYFIEYFDN